jgi:serine/threonine protein kinase
MSDQFATSGIDLLPLEQAREIDLLCDDFEKNWQQGNPRLLEDYLSSASPAMVAALREELIQVELDCRFLRGDPPRLKEYQTRFPEYDKMLLKWIHLAEQRSKGSLGLGQATQPDTLAHDALGQTSETDPVAKGVPETFREGALGEYELLGPLGVGGMGEVYRARHRRLGKVVALKVIRSGASGSADDLARFRREMAAVGQLDHPHLVEAHDAGEQDGVLYLVLKLIDGVDLHRLVKDLGPLPVAEACELIRQAALGLQYLHERGLVHRDIKPSNLMRTPAGMVKVLDLGLSRWTAPSLAGELTAANQVMGTPDFISPEQINEAAAVDIRADIYSLGATLFYLLTGRAPFAHRTDILAKLRAHGEEAPPDIRSLQPGIPSGVAALVSQMLAKQPEQRPTTPQEVGNALAPFTSSTPTTTFVPANTNPIAGEMTVSHPSLGLSVSKPRTRRRRSTVGIVAASVLVCLLGVWMTLTLFNQTPKRLLTFPDPGVETTKPLRVLRLDVNHFARDGKFDDPRGLLGQRSFTTSKDDGVEVKAELSAPAYCYLIAFRPDGTEDLCFPEKEDEVPPLSDRPGYPSTTSGVRYGLTDGVGLQAFVLVASSKPLPAYAKWRPSRGASPWQQSEAQAGVVWRLEDGVAFRAHTAADPEARGKGQEIRGLGSLPAVITWLRQAPEVEAIAAVAFAVAERK